MAKENRFRPARGKTWREKRDLPHPNHGTIVTVPPAARKKLGAARLLIPRPTDVDRIMRGVRKGRLITVTRIREQLAAAAGADHACPLCTGIFVRIAAEAAVEEAREGRARVTPYWRTVKEGGKLNEKYPGGAAAQAAKLREEGHEIERDRKGRPARVKDYEKRVVA